MRLPLVTDLNPGGGREIKRDGGGHRLLEYDSRCILATGGADAGSHPEESES